MSTMCRVALTCALVSSIQQAHAAPTAGWTMLDNHAYGHVVTFDTVAPLADNTLVGNQFQPLGVSFSGSLRANGCGYNVWMEYGMQNNTVGTYGPGCEVNRINDEFAIRFDRTVSALALDAYLLDNSRIATLDLYLKGSLVTSFAMPTLSYDGLAMNASTYQGGRYFANSEVDRVGILRIGGALFDEIRFAENFEPHHYGYLLFDNLRFDTVASTDVPEPASLGLVALGLAGLGAMRRKRKGIARA